MTDADGWVMSLEAQARYDAIRARMRAEREAASAEAKPHALAAVTITDPTGHEMLPAEVRVDRDGDRFSVVLDYGPRRHDFDNLGPREATAAAWAFIHLLGGVEYDLSELPDGTDERNV